MRYWIFSLIFFAVFGTQAAESLTAFFSQKTNEIWEWQACGSATQNEIKSLSTTLSVCLPRNQQRKTFDEISEKLFFEYASRRQLAAYQCVADQTKELLQQPATPSIQLVRQAVAQDFSTKIPKIRDLQRKLNSVESELAEMERAQTTSPMGETFYQSTVDDQRQKRLRHKQKQLFTAIATLKQSFWQSENKFIQQRMEVELQREKFDPNRFASEFLSSNGDGSFNSLLAKIQNGARQDQNALLKGTTKSQGTVSDFQLSDADKMRLYRDRNWIASDNKGSDRHFSALSCRLEGRYGQGRERFHKTVEVGSAVALTFLPGGFYLAAGRGLMTVAAARTLALVSSSGVAATSLASIYDQKCSRSNLKHAISASCSMPSKTLIQELGDENCALNVALAALDVPLPELKSTSLALAGVSATLKGAGASAKSVVGSAAHQLKGDLAKVENLQVSLWKAKEAGLLAEAQKAEATVRKLLQEGKMAPTQLAGNSKSGAFFVQYENGLQGVWKPKTGSVANGNSEIAVELIDRHLGTNMVPVTVPRTLNGIEGTVQLRVSNLKTETLEPYPDVLGYFDYLIGNSDRHANNYLVTNDGRMIAIDHGKAFDPEFSFTQREILEDHLTTLTAIRNQKKTLQSQANKSDHADAPLVARLKNLEKLEDRAYQKALKSATNLTPPKEVIDRLRQTQRDDWKKILGPLLDEQKIDQLMNRQREILEVVDQTERVLGPNVYRTQGHAPFLENPSPK